MTVLLTTGQWVVSKDVASGKHVVDLHLDNEESYDVKRFSVESAIALIKSQPLLATAWTPESNASITRRDARDLLVASLDPTRILTRTTRVKNPPQGDVYWHLTPVGLATNQRRILRDKLPDRALPPHHGWAPSVEDAKVAADEALTAFGWVLG